MKNYNDMTPEEKKAADEKRRAEQEYRWSIPGILEHAEKEIAEKRKETDNLKSAYTKYPDLKQNTNRWGTVRYYSASVNDKVDKYDCSHNCGCCSDSPLELWPYLETAVGKVYSDPPCFQIGERHWISGDVSYPGWKQKLRDAKIPEAIIEKVSHRFREDADYRKEIAESYDYEEED